MILGYPFLYRAATYCSIIVTSCEISLKVGNKVFKGLRRSLNHQKVVLYLFSTILVEWSE